MKPAFYLLVMAFLVGSCSKNNDQKIEIYLLSSFQFKIDSTGYPAITLIVNPVLAASPLVANIDIESYSPGSHTFTLRRDIKNDIINLGPDKAFALCANKEVVYYGKFHPAYLSSVTLGLATIDPVFYSDKRLTIYYVTFAGAPNLEPLDKRNDAKLLAALAASNRLR